MIRRSSRTATHPCSGKMRTAQSSPHRSPRKPRTPPSTQEAQHGRIDSAPGGLCAATVLYPVSGGTSLAPSDATNVAYIYSEEWASSNVHICELFETQMSFGKPYCVENTSEAEGLKA